MKPSIIARVLNQVSTWKPFKIDEKLTPPSKTDKKRISYQIQVEKKPLFTVGQDDLKMGIQMATDPIDPRREKLHQVYTEAKRDLHLLSQITNAIDDVLQQGGGMFDPKTDELDKEATQLLKKQWFEHLLRIYLNTEFDGYRIAEIDQMRQTKLGWEISKVRTFPEDHVLPERGLLIAHPQAQHGLPYRPDMYLEDKEKMILAEAVSEWLIECGDPAHLGLNAVASINAIYKKYGKADWAKSSEKWMDPTVIIKSATDDKTENDKKADAATKLGNNNWMILDSEDEVSLLERRNAGGYTITKEFLEYLDTDTSKGINGQTATSDEQAWSGSSEVQERLQMKRTRRRSRSATYWLNEVVIPKLIGLNNGDSAYKILDGLEWRFFEFKGEEEGNTTDPDQNDDPKKPTAKTKQSGGTGTGKSPTNAASAFHIDLTNSYVPWHDIQHPGDIHNSATLERLAQKMVDKVYERKIRPGQIDGTLTQAQADELVRGLKQGYGDTLTNPKFASPEHRLRAQLQYNVHVMAAFKNHQNVVEIHALLFDANGKLKTKAQFVKDVKAINADYNKHWAGSEYRLAVGQGQMADKYLYYKDRGGSFVYVSMNDGRVRPEHEELHGFTAPVDHPIWDSILPKNGWGCRCWFRWIREAIEKISEQAKTYAENLPAMFKNNPGKSGKVFNEHHPYFAIAERFLDQAEKLFSFRPPIHLERFSQNMAIYEGLAENANYQMKHSNLDTGGFLFGHKLADSKDLAGNLKAGKLLADKGYAVEIREHVTATGIKNPELGLNGIVTDLKTPEKVGGIKSAFNTARKQHLDTVVIEINSRWKTESILKSLDAGFVYNTEIDKAILLYKGDVIEVTRSEWQGNALESLIKK